jgi:general L-amino acid transport system permease protein
MAAFNARAPGGQERIPPWRDIRVLGVLAQIVFFVMFVLSASWLLSNIAQNLFTLGGNQFLCRDGSSSIRCAFDFLRLEARFPISESVIEYDPSMSYGRALLVGLLNTAKVGFFGIILATILGTLTGIARLSSNWLVSNIARWYVDIIRNTPLLLQLFFLYFGVILLFPGIRDAIQPFGLPIYLSQRGINIPSPVLMPSFAVWLAFIILGILQAQALWILLGRREERTGEAANRPLWMIVSFLIVVIVGWFVASGSAANNQGFLAPQSLRVEGIDDLSAMMQGRMGLENLNEIDAALEDGRLTQEALDEATLRVCSIEGDRSEANLTSQLRRANIPYRLERSEQVSGATELYAAGECALYVAPRVTLSGERTTLEDSASHVIVPVAETPVRFSVPRIEGLNFVGGNLLSPNFAAILIGLTVYTGAFIAEIVRAGIQSVPKGQSEAARALGLSEAQRLRLVVLPQALRVIIPPLTSQYLNLVKNSSLAIAVAYPDLFLTAFVTLNQSGRAVQVFLIVMAAYLSFSLLISFFLNWYNERIALVER